MPPRTKQGLALLLAAGAGSQAGHLVAYAVRFGGAAAAAESQGAHAYFPLTAQLLAGLAGGLSLLALTAIAGARLLGGARQAGRRPLMDLLPLLFLLQLALFAGQETLETAAAGAPGPDAVTLLLWGALGQLPAALAGALALSWLSGRVEAAVETLRRLGRRAGRDLRPLPALRFRPHAVPIRMAAQAAPGAGSKRGPPLPLGV